MVSPLPNDIACHARVLQRIGQEIGECHFKDAAPAVETIGVSITAHWIDTFGILHIEWDWFGTLDKGVVRMLNEHPSALVKTSVKMADNLSQAGKMAVFSIDKILVRVDGIARTVIKVLKPSNSWQELVRNTTTW